MKSAIKSAMQNNTWNRLGRLTLGLALCLVTGCSTSSDRRSVESPTLAGFPPQAFEGIVYAQARYEDSRHAFGLDLLREHGIVPVFLTMELRGDGQDSAQILLRPERMNLNLYLADGTAIPQVAADEVAGLVDEDHAARVREKRFRGGLLAPRPTEGFVFFGMPPSDALRGGGSVIVRPLEANYERRFDVAESLLTLNVTVGGSERPLYVGIER